METPSFSVSANARPIPPALGYSGAALALWIFRRPILALTGAAAHLAFALVKPTLLVLGAVKLADLLRASRESTLVAPSVQSTQGNEVALPVPAHSVSPAYQASPTALEV